MAIPDKPLTRQEQYLDAIAKAGGGGGSALPSVTSADNGKVLSVVDGAWAADEKRFVVTLTPTGAGEMSGTMDKTPAEIDGAWNSGKSIWFSIPVVGIMMPMSARIVLEDVEGGGVKYFAHAIMDGSVLNVITSTSGNTYTFENYQLTPMGS